MIDRIARKQFLDTVRDGRFRVLAPATLLIAVTAAAAGWHHYDDVQRQHEAARRATREQWLRQPAKNPHSAAHYGVYAFKPVSRLSVLDTGVDPYVGVAAWLEAHKQNEFKYRPAQDRTALQRFGDLTVADGLVLLVPLLIVLVTFDAFTGEREQGTLRQVLSLGVAPRDLALGKALGVSAALGAVLVPCAAAGALAIAWSAGGQGLAADAPRALSLAALYLAYFATLVAIGLGVSARARSSRTALVSLLGFWFVTALVAPRAASDIADAAYPTPSAVEFQTAIDRDLADSADMDRRLQRRREELMRQYQATSLEALPVNFAGIALQEGEEHANKVFDTHFGRLFGIYERQNRLHQYLALGSPALAARASSMALAGTDLAHHRTFVEAAENYRRDLQRVLNNDIAQHAKPGATYTAGPDLWERVPEFTYTAPSLGWALGQSRTAVLIVTAWLAAALLFASRSLLHLRVD
jgi:ABC-2 type transport system permease protein